MQKFSIYRLNQVESEYQWKYGAENVLPVRILQMKKVQLIGYRKQLFARL